MMRAPPEQELHRTPPHDLAAERAVLGSVLIKPDAMDEVVGFLSVDDFFLPAHREVWVSMLDIFQRGRAVDILTLADDLRRRDQIQRLDGGESYLLTLSNAVPTAENVRHYAQIVKDKATLRKIIAVCTEAISRAYGNHDPSELLTDHRLAITAIDGGDDLTVKIGDGLEATLDRIDHESRKPDAYVIKTGLTDFDEEIGGLREEQLIIVASNPGQGKTSWAFTTSIRIAMSGVPVLYMSYEMPRHDMFSRAISFASGVPGTNIFRARLGKEEWMSINSGSKQLFPLPLWLTDKKMACGRSCAVARQWRRRHAPEGRALVVVDYLGLVRPDRRTDNRAYDVGTMSLAYKELAGEIKAPVMVVSQLNRDNVKGDKVRKPKPSDLRESGSIEQDADMIIFPWREPGGGNGPGLHQAELIVAKHRNGPVGTIEVQWSAELMAFYDRPREDTGDRRLPPDDR